MNERVAVKKLFNTHIYEAEFNREVECLMRVKHKNIVRFLGYCADTQGSMQRLDKRLVMADVQNRLLCFEYVPNRSLHDYITGKSKISFTKVHFTQISPPYIHTLCTI